jgi:hypothetical protein
MGIRRKLIKVDEFAPIWADGHRVEGTRLYVLELLMFGFAYSSYYILLESQSFLSRLDDEKLRTEVVMFPCRFGKRLEFGSDLERNGETDCVYYIRTVDNGDLLDPAK